VVDIAIIAAVVYLAKSNVKEPVVWAILSAITAGRFGVSHNKTLERATRSGGGGDSSRSGSGWPATTPERDPRSFPGAVPMPKDPTPPRRPPIPRQDPERKSLPELAVPRLYDLIRAVKSTPMPWWARRSVAVPFLPARVDVVSLTVFLVLTFSMIRVFAVH
jgi:hypothetical protein